MEVVVDVSSRKTVVEVTMRKALPFSDADLVRSQARHREAAKQASELRSYNQYVIEPSSSSKSYTPSYQRLLNVKTRGWR